jgi:WS/DGAT/MGAT family acyltransferase
VDDEHFSIDYHLRHSSLPRPGTEAQLKLLAGRIVSTPLDRSKPLWELWVVEGLDDDRFALIAKIHHCMIDGISGVDLTTTLLNVVPTSDIEQGGAWSPRPAPTPTQLTVSEMARTARRAIDSLGSAGEAITSGRDRLGRAAQRVGAAANSLKSGWLTAADRTPLNPEIGPNRRFEWTDMDLASIKEIKNALGGTVNDIVLTIVAGGVRHYLETERDYSVSKTEFRVMAPVSVRKPGQRGTLGNQVAMWLVNLPISDPDPRRRLAAIRSETKRLKATNQALGAATMVDLSKGTPIPVLSLAARVVSNAIRPFNMTVTNVPGPQFPMYLLEARMLVNYPIVPLWGQHGLGIALFSYDGRLLWGIHTDYDAVPDPAAVARSLQHSFKTLLNASTD